MSEKIFPVCIIGAGLAGSECAWQLAKRGIEVALVEMRPKKSTPAHQTDKPAELVCSNSLRSSDINNAVGLLKEEMASLDSLIIKAAYKARVPAGSALAVDRDLFSDFILKELKALKNVHFINEVVVDIERDEGRRARGEGCNHIIKIMFESGESLYCQSCVIATGPLTDEKLAEWILKTTNQEYLYFYDSIAPIVEFDSIDMTKAFKANRYNKGQDDGNGEGDYINCPMTKDEFENFINAIERAELAEVHDFDKAQFFEGCLPIEEMVRRGRETLRFGPMKPVGLYHQKNSEQELEISRTSELEKNENSSSQVHKLTSSLIKHHAVVQLRQDNLHASLFNMVGFQTRMKWGEQKKIFRMIPGLENAEFVRMGAMHRNTYICSPALLDSGMELKKLQGVHFAGQITGCEGYVESAAVGLYVGLSLKDIVGARHAMPLPMPPQTTALGALIHHILHADPTDYQPMNINFGLFFPLEGKFRKRERKVQMVKRASEDFREWIDDNLK